MAVVLAAAALITLALSACQNVSDDSNSSGGQTPSTDPRVSSLTARAVAVTTRLGNLQIKSDAEDSAKIAIEGAKDAVSSAAGAVAAKLGTSKGKSARAAGDLTDELLSALGSAMTRIESWTESIATAASSGNADGMDNIKSKAASLKNAIDTGNAAEINDAVAGKYTVHFDMQNHGDVAPDDQTVSSGEKVNKVANPIDSDGWTFGGWYKNKSFTDDSKWDFDSNTVDKDETLYAKWMKVTFQMNGHGTVSTAQVAEDGSVTQPDTPTANNFAFFGWYKDNECNNGWAFNYDKASAGIETTLYAKWQSGTTYIGTLTLGISSMTIATTPDSKVGIAGDITKDNTISIRMPGGKGLGTMQIQDYTIENVTVTKDSETENVYKLSLGSWQAHQTRNDGSQMTLKGSSVEGTFENGKLTLKVTFQPGSMPLDVIASFTMD